MPKREVNSPMMSIADTAKYLKTDINLVKKAIDAGILPVFDLGSKKVYRPEVDKFIEKYMGLGKGQALQKQLETKDLKPGERRLIL